MKKIILHLCADIGSDSRYYQLDDNYEVIKIGIDIGVENYTPPKNVYGVIANPVCTEFSRARNANIERDHEKGMFLVNHCLRIIEECKPKFWVLENPSSGYLRKYLGKPKHTYHPWHFGSPWTKATGLWGEFNMPEKIYNNWEDVPKNDKLYIKPKATKPALAAIHKSSKELIPEMEWAKHLINDDMSLRSWCSQGFAKAFYEANILITETYKKGVFIEKQEVIKWLKNSPSNPEVLKGIRYNDDSESYIIKITLTNDEIQKII